MSAGGAVLDIIIITAAAGVLIGVLNLTGLAFGLTLQLLSVSGGSLAVLLVVTAIVAIILGLGLPTVGVYVILATLAAPALVKAGLSPMQAHMFVMYFGMMSMVTPPVALAAFAAANIAQSDHWKTGWTATRVGWCSYIIPFLFALSPTLLMEGVPLRNRGVGGDGAARRAARDGGGGRPSARCADASEADDLRRGRPCAARSGRRVCRRRLDESDRRSRSAPSLVVYEFYGRAALRRAA